MKKIELPKDFSGLLEKINEKNFYYIFTGSLLLIFLLYYFVLIRPQLNAFWKITPEIKDLSENIAKTQNDINNLQNYKNKVDQLKLKLETMRAKVKSRQEVPIILEKISRIANENNVKIDQIMPESTDMSLLLSDNQNKYFSLPIVVEADSSYHAFGKFLNKLEQDEIFFRTAMFSINSQSNSRTNKVKLTLNTIVYEPAKPK